MASRLRAVTALVLFLAAGAPPASAQWTALVTVEEPAGIRRTAFPTRVRFEFPEARLESVNQVRLMDGSTEVAAQGTAWSTWSDGSVREIELDFNLSIGPFEERPLQLQYGRDVAGSPATNRGLVPSEDERGVQVGRVRLTRVGSPLLSSVAYRQELIGEGRNGITVVERSGIRRDPREISWEPVRVVKSGPLVVLLRYRGRLGLSGGRSADITLDVEMPSSKSWVKISASVADADGRVGDVTIETPLRLGPHPWTWDFSTPNATYGTFRDPTGSAIFTRTFDGAGTGAWQILAGPAGAEQPYEQSSGSLAASGTWAHFTGAEEAVAFAIESSPGAAGRITVWLTGTGQTSIGFRSAEPVTEHALTVYQHYVATPLAIGAATSPASILHPLRVSVE